jgi:1-acyl-sn-glycerol-3-phosphate acyltransferase
MTASTFVFYHTVHTAGAERLPKHGEPTILCFNHSNGLTDIATLIRVTDRMVRFAGKDTLWDHWFWG